MKKKHLFVLLVLIIFQILPLVAQITVWQINLNSYLEKSDYQNLVKYLNEIYPEMTKDDQAVISLLLSFYFSKLSDKDSESIWCKKYLEEFNEIKSDLKFIPSNDELEILAYEKKIHENYLTISSITINEHSKKIKYFNLPKEIIVDIEPSIPCQLKVFDLQSTLLGESDLKKGINSFRLPINEEYVKSNNHFYKFSIISGSQKKEKNIEIELGYNYAGNVNFDPKTREVRIVGKEFLDEAKKTISITSKTKFDKKTFSKSVLANCIVGGLFLLSNSQIIDKLRNENISVSAKTSLDISKKSISILGIGAILVGIHNLTKAFKKDIKKVETVENIPEAIVANEKLTQEIELQKDNIYIEIKINTI